MLSDQNPLLTGGQAYATEPGVCRFEGTKPFANRCRWLAAGCFEGTSHGSIAWPCAHVWRPGAYAPGLSFDEKDTRALRQNI